MLKKLLKRALPIFLVLGFLTLVYAESPKAAYAATTRNASTYTELTAAITASVDGDTINITRDIINTAEIPIAKALTIEGNGYTISVPVPGLDESGIYSVNPSTWRVFNISATGKTVTIQNMTIKGGSVSSQGAGIANTSGTTLKLTGVTISNSRGNGVGGGGLLNYGGNVYMKDCNVSRNAANYGGGFLNISSGARMFVENSNFTENRSTSESGGGGACENHQYLYINNSTFSNNKSTELGGAINNAAGTAYVVNSTFSGNIAYGGYMGGAIAQNGGSVTLINSLFAYNYRNNGGTYVLNDIDTYNGTPVKAYHSIFQTLDITEINNVAGSISYAGNASGSDNSIFTGGSTTKVLGPDGAEVGTGTVFQPFLVKGGAGKAPTLKTGSFALAKGTKTGFTNGNGTPIIGYYNGSSWVDLVGSSSSSYEVTKDQNYNTRALTPAPGAVETIVDDVFMLKVNSSVNGVVNGGTVYGDVFASGTNVTLTAMPYNGYAFTRWDYVLGSGTASTNNPYTVTVNQNTTLVPIFSTYTGYTITYVGNGETGGAPPASESHSSGSANIASQETLTKSGYAFSGWNTRANGSGTSYSAGSTFSAGTNLTLYAQWSVVVSNIKPTVSNSTINGYEDVSLTFSLVDFSNYYSDPDSTPLAQVQITTLPNFGLLALSGVAVTQNQVISSIDFGNLTYTPVANSSGNDNSFTWYGSDGTDFSLTTASMVLNIFAVNDAPSFTKGGNQVVYDVAGAQNVSNWATAISAGPSDEAAQTVNFIVTNNNNTLFISQPSIDASGKLTYTPAANANGTAIVTVQIHDDGGITNVGVDTSSEQTFTIKVNHITPPVINFAKAVLGKVYLDWNAPVGMITTNYAVYRNSTQIALLDSLTTVYTDTTVTPGTSYAYKVFALGSENSTSNEVALIAARENEEKHAVPTDQQTTITTEDSSLKVVIPPGAFTQTAIVTSHKLSEPNVSPRQNGLKLVGDAYEFKAIVAGTLNQKATFAKPLNVTMEYSSLLAQGVIEDTISLYYYNPTTGIWENIGGTKDKVNKIISAKVTHFSEYAVLGETELKIYTPTSLSAISAAYGVYNNTVSLDKMHQSTKFNPDGKTNYPYEIYLPNEGNPAAYRIHSNYTKNTDACASCHRTHTAVGASLLQWYSVYETCMACHDGTVTTTYNVVNGKIGTSATLTYGGMFGMGMENSLSSHNVTGAVTLASAPGGSVIAEDITNIGSETKQRWTSEFGCQSCHSPHGAGGNARILNPDPNYTAAYKAPSTGYYVSTSYVVYADPAYTEPVYILKGYPYNATITIKSGVAVLEDAYINNINGYSIIINGNTATAVYGIAAIAVKMNVQNYLQGNETVTHIAGMNNFCGACHTDYENYQTADNATGTYSKAHRHQVGMDQTEKAQQIAKYNMPLESGKLECLTCHVAHGSNSEYWLNSLSTAVGSEYYGDTDVDTYKELSGSSALKRQPNMGVCETCHDKSAGVEGYFANTNTSEITQTALTTNPDKEAMTSVSGKAYQQCISCHENNSESYQHTVHFLADNTGAKSAPECITCHKTEITCEDCHGNAGSHIKQPSAINIISPRNLSVSQQTYICDACHKSTEIIPGESVAGYTYHTGTASWNLSKHALSGSVSCTTCHDTHKLNRQGASLKYTYQELCLSCHDQGFDKNLIMPTDTYTVNSEVYMSKSHKFELVQ